MYLGTNYLAWYLCIHSMFMCRHPDQQYSRKFTIATRSMQVQDRNATNNKFTESATTVCTLYALSEYFCSYQFNVEHNITNNPKTIVQLQTEKHLLMNKIRDTIHPKAETLTRIPLAFLCTWRSNPAGCGISWETQISRSTYAHRIHSTQRLETSRSYNVGPAVIRRFINPINYSHRNHKA